MVSELFLYSKRIFIMQQGFSPDIKLRQPLSLPSCIFVRVVLTGGIRSRVVLNGGIQFRIAAGSLCFQKNHRRFYPADKDGSEPGCI